MEFLLNGVGFGLATGALSGGELFVNFPVGFGLSNGRKLQHVVSMNSLR